jgi:hypothetical protein
VPPSGDYKLLLVRCAEQRRAYVYAYSDDGWRAAFADLPGQGFEVERVVGKPKLGDAWSDVDMGRAYQKGEVLPACGARPRPLAASKKPAAAAAPTAQLAPGAISSCRLSFVGFDDDKVGPTFLHQPDGRLDGHLQVAARFAPDVELLAIALYSAVPDGRPHGGLVWHSSGAPHWVLGVYDGGRALNETPGPSLGRFSGEKTFDLYAADGGWFVQGNWLLVMAWLGDGRALVDCAEVGRWGK